jgi:glutathione S-transferase
MDLYFAPLACSMATRMACYEGEVEVRFIQVDTRTKRLADGSDYLPINGLGQVPVLRTDDGELLRENTVVLPYVAAQSDTLRALHEQRRLEIAQWLSFIGSELHKLVFTPLLDHSSNDGARDFARAKAVSRFDHLNAHLEKRDHLIGPFSVADPYLTVVLNWSGFTGIDLDRWPAVAAYLARMKQRPAIARAMREEVALFQDQQRRSSR